MASELNVGTVVASTEAKVLVNGNAILRVEDSSAANQARLHLRSGTQDWYVRTSDGGTNLVFEDDGAERVSIDSAGLATFSNGIAVTTGGIQFPATQSASADANTLDDYEEGTWTGTLTAGTPPTTPPTATGNYTRVGNAVNIQIYFALADTSGGSGQMKVTGLPFASANVNDSNKTTFTPATLGLAANGNEWGQITRNSAEASFLHSVNNLDWAITSITAGTGKYLQFSATYRV